MRVIDAAATARALPFERLVPALRTMFAQGCNVPARQVLEVAEGVTSLVMSAWGSGEDGAGRYYAVKVINIARGNAARGLPGLHARVLLHDATTGEPLALIDGDVLTHRRTAAASALAASWLARADARHLLVVGAGPVAACLPAAYRVVRPIDRVTVWARRPEQARSLAERWRAEGWNAVATTELQAAVRAADIVSCATGATEPLISGGWLAPGSHLDLIGSFTPAMREADDACFRGAGVYVDTEEALVKSGDLLAPMASGAFRAADLRGTLAQLARGQAAGRRDAAERTLFKSVGTALEDLAAAILVWEAAG
jgi:ornithine cyclodeaminase